MAGPVFLTPAVEALLNKIGTPPPASSLSPEQLRAGLDGAIAALGWPEGAGPDQSLSLASGAGLYLFHPRQQVTAPVIIYAHGGSFVAGGLRGHASACRHLARVSGCAVALVDYRLAPEHPAPAALDDVVAGAQAVREHASSWAVNPARLGLFGDSAGGALATAAALKLRDQGADARILAVMNPMTSPAASGGSLDAFSTGYFATTADFIDGWNRYGPAVDPYHDLLAVADLSGLPPTVVWTNEADPVRDQGETLAERIATAGGTVLLQRIRGLIHAAWLFGRALPEAKLVAAAIGGMVGTMLHDHQDAP